MKDNVDFELSSVLPPFKDFTFHKNIHKFKTNFLSWKYMKFRQTDSTMLFSEKQSLNRFIWDYLVMIPKQTLQAFEQKLYIEWNFRFLLFMKTFNRQQLYRNVLYTSELPEHLLSCRRHGDRDRLSRSENDFYLRRLHRYTPRDKMRDI